MFDIFSAWINKAEKLKSSETNKEEYDNWRYNYPHIEDEQTKETLDKLRAEKDNPSDE